MLREAFTYLTTPCAQPYRKMGYLSELIALDARFKRCKRDWQPHLEATKETIRAAIATTSRREKTIVLGCGILSDIPLDHLADTFNHVLLVDVCLLGRTRRQISRYPNVDWRCHDVTDVTVDLDRWIMSRSDTMLPSPKMPSGWPLDDADLVISANILSQLPMLPLNFLEKHRPDVEEHARANFAETLVRRHVERLRSCPGTVCLITEVERQFVGDAGLMDTDDPFWGHTFEMIGEEWIWDIAPRTETGANYAVRNRVKGMVWNNRGS